MHIYLWRILVTGPRVLKRRGGVLCNERHKKRKKGREVEGGVGSSPLVPALRPIVCPPSVWKNRKGWRDPSLPPPPSSGPSSSYRCRPFLLIFLFFIFVYIGALCCIFLLVLLWVAGRRSGTAFQRPLPPSGGLGFPLNEMVPPTLEGRKK